MKVLTLCTISRDGKRHPAGTEIELPDATAEGLLARIPPAVARIAQAETSLPPRGLDARASVRALVPQIKEADASALATLRAAELAREDGPRSSVLAAIDERLDALAASTDDDESDENDDDEDDAE